MKRFFSAVGMVCMLLPLGCSKSEDGPAGPEGDGTAGTGGGSPVGPGEPASTDPGVGGASSEAMNPDTPLVGNAGSAGDSMGAAVTGEGSSLPAPPTTGVPRPSGSADGLAVVDWAGFRAAVSYTFDDANTSQIENYDALAALEVPFTFYLWTNMSGAMSDVWARAVEDGHEIGNHTQSHQMGDALTIGEDTDAGEAFIESSLGITVYTMAAPYGNTQYADVARTRYLINRGTVGGQIAPNDTSDPFNLPTFIPLTEAPASAFNTRIDTARAAGAWETVLVHGFVGGTDQAYQPVALSEFEAAVNYSKSFGDVWVGTIVDVGAYWIAQKLIGAATPTTEGDVTTWQWTLPEHFPPNQFVRVTVNGGTLQQNGLPLPWNEHGYYEVDLDSGSVTLSP